MITSTLQGKKILIQRFRQNSLLVSFLSAFVDHRDILRGSKVLGIGVESLEALLAKPVPAQLELSQPPEQPVFQVRPETGRAVLGQYTSAATALQNATTGQVIEWIGTEHTCILDIDFPKGTEPDGNQLLAFTATIEPRPVLYWLSRSGGVHLLYQCNGTYAADEFASVASYHYLRRYSHCKAELLHRTRSASAHVYLCNPTYDIGVLRSLLAENSATDNEEFLAVRGWTVGERLEHTSCPVNPTPRGEANSGPVMVHADHVYCFICNADGRRSGSRTPGYFPFSALTGSRVETQIARAVNNFVHWSHAKQIIGLRIHNDLLAQRIYSALLKLKHEHDTRIPIVFTAGEPYGIVRYNGYWCNNNGEMLKVDKTSAILASLPQCKDCDRVGNLTPNDAAREWLAQPVNLSPRGYIPVTPVQGFHFTRWQELPDNKLFIPLRNATIPEDRQPKYLADNERMLLDNAWMSLEKIYPGLDRKLLELLLIGRGCTEHRSGLVPMLFLTGTTGSGKTAHVQLAANICGDTASSLQLNRDTDRFFNEFLTAKRRSGFVFFDEFFKFAKQADLTDLQAM